MAHFTATPVRTWIDRRDHRSTAVRYRCRAISELATTLLAIVARTGHIARDASHPGIWVLRVVDVARVQRVHMVRTAARPDHVAQRNCR
jgi:hypothetical protein